MNKYKALLIIALILLAGIFFFFYRLYQNDVKALTNFLAAYQKFDQAVSNYSTAVFASNQDGASAADALEQKTDEALAELNTRASVRISSLIKNDGELMRAALEIEELSGKETSSLKAYRMAVAGKSTDLDRLAAEQKDLAAKRKTAYAHFRDLDGLDH